MDKPFAQNFFVKKLYLIFIFLFEMAFAQSLHPCREMRAVWITTVGNIDWPSRKGLEAELQQKEYSDMLDKLKKHNFNAVLTQIRPSADALYESSYEPWAEVLQGKQGQAPKPYYDPTAWMIEQCHKRNIEFHAWVNPFRAISSVTFSHIHPDHITQKEPEWFFKYGDRVYFNPGIPEVRAYLVKIIMEIVRKYDIDGLHFDDYFYPYKINGERINDDNTFDKFGKDFTNIEDWRRNNIDLFIQAVSDSLKIIKPKVKFGVSPAGGWRNKAQDPRGSDTRVGQPSYDHLYADTRKWLEKGWLDYLTPQIYWSTQSKYAPYETLIRWWDENCFGRHIYGGHGAFKIGDANEEPTWQQSDEIFKQINLNRRYKNVQGSMFFSAKSMLKNPLKILDTLQNKYYKYPALMPAMPWKDSIPPLPPDSLRAAVLENAIALKWAIPRAAQDGEKPSYYVVFKFENEMAMNLEDASKIIAIQKDNFFLDKEVEQNKRYIYVVRSFDKLHNESTQYAIVKVATVRKLTMASPIREGKLEND
jgi:uncharacterized lipoprotein YddW (UPF0748 family)